MQSHNPNRTIPSNLEPLKTANPLESPFQSYDASPMTTTGHQETAKRPQQLEENSRKWLRLQKPRGDDQETISPHALAGFTCLQWFPVHARLLLGLKVLETGGNILESNTDQLRTHVPRKLPVLSLFALNVKTRTNCLQNKTDTTRSWCTNPISTLPNSCRYYINPRKALQAWAKTLHHYEHWATARKTSSSSLQHQKLEVCAQLAEAVATRGVGAVVLGHFENLESRVSGSEAVVGGSLCWACWRRSGRIWTFLMLLGMLFRVWSWVVGRLQVSPSKDCVLLGFTAVWAVVSETPCSFGRKYSGGVSSCHDLRISDETATQKAEVRVVGSVA